MGCHQKRAIVSLAAGGTTLDFLWSGFTASVCAEELRHAKTVDIESELIGAGRACSGVDAFFDLIGIHIKRAQALGASNNDLS